MPKTVAASVVYIKAVEAKYGSGAWGVFNDTDPDQGVFNDTDPDQGVFNDTDPDHAATYTWWVGNCFVANMLQVGSSPAK